MENNRKAFRIGGLLAPFFLFLLLGPNMSAQSTYRASNELQIAQGYLQQARVLYRNGRFDSAARLLDVSLQFFPEYSESHFLYALLYRRKQENTWRAIEHLETAIQSGTWVDTDPLTAAAELLDLYVCTSRFQEARSLFLEQGETGLGGRGSPELSRLWARTLIGLGDLASAQAFLSDAVRRFPESPRLYVLLAEVLSRRGNPAAARSVLERGIREMPDEEELLYRLAELERNADRRLDLVERYIEAGGSDPGAAVLALTAGLRDRQRFIDIFFIQGGQSRIGYMDTLLGSAVGQSVAAMTNTYTGKRTLDENRDGYYEQLYEYKDGLLLRWISDRDQDGIPEAAVDFEDGKPVTASLRFSDGVPSVRYGYSEYPFLETAVLVSGASRREYRLVPYTLRRPAFVEAAGGRLRRDLRADLDAGEPLLRRNSFQMAEYLSGGPNPDRLVYLLDGRITRIDEAPDSLGKYTSTIHYTASLPVTGSRDLDGDGWPEIREEFREGKLWRISLDQDGDGVEEFEQVLDGESSRLSWDYNDDGTFDSREILKGDGSVVRGFSSGLNGAFDLSAAEGRP
jgi:tetratricopeptide (TPR) repeat protein